MGVEAWGIEADPNVQRIAEHFDLKVHIGNLYEKPFPEIKFDLIVLNQVIEHVPDPALLLSEIKDRLKHGGEVILSFPNTKSLLCKLSSSRWINWHVPFHQHHFNINNFSRLAASSGYKVLKTETITPNLWFDIQRKVLLNHTFKKSSQEIWGDKSLHDVLIKRNLLDKLWIFLKGYLSHYSGYLIAPINRIIDILGYGDSIVIHISPIGSIHHENFKK